MKLLSAFLGTHLSAMISSETTLTMSSERTRNSFALFVFRMPHPLYYIRILQQQTNRMVGVQKHLVTAGGHALYRPDGRKCTDRANGEEVKKECRRRKKRPQPIASSSSQSAANVKQVNVAAVIVVIRWKGNDSTAARLCGTLKRETLPPGGQHQRHACPYKYWNTYLIRNFKHWPTWCRIQLSGRPLRNYGVPSSGIPKLFRNSVGFFKKTKNFREIPWDSIAIPWDTIPWDFLRMRYLTTESQNS